MPNLQPYASPMYFIILIIALLPLMIALAHGVRLKIYEILVSAGFIFLMFTGAKWQEGVALLFYCAWQVILTQLYARERRKNNRTPAFYVAVVLAILPLALVKLTPLFSPQPSLLGFLGISYLTFKAVQVIMELRDGTIKELHVWPFLRFLLFMPTISSGPIDRYRRFTKDYQQVPDRAAYTEMVANGIHYLFMGFLYKFILGYFFGSVLLPAAEQAALGQKMALGGTGISWALIGYMYCYSMYLFFDFAGYSLFAVSISHFMGIKTPQNFNKPFLAGNIKEFWNRWHMSLSFWFRDFVFMRTTFFIMKHRLIKKRVHVSQVAYLINFLVMGFWHGVTWYYIVYGLFHAGAIIVNDMWLRKKKKMHLPHNKLTQALAIFVTVNVVCFSFLIFSGFLDTLWFK